MEERGNTSRTGFPMTLNFVHREKSTAQETTREIMMILVHWQQVDLLLKKNDFV